MISIQQASKQFGTKTLFQQLTWEAPQHEITVLLGGNGAGKSTLLEIIAGLSRLDKGEILYDGEYASPKKRREVVGYVPQDIALWEHLTIRQNLAFFRGLTKHPITEQQVQQYCETLQLSEHDLQTAVSKLSGGTKRKANIIVGLLGNPKLLLLDEPTVGIDLKSRYAIQQLLRQLKDNCTILMTTHHIDELKSVANNVVVLGEDPFYENVLKEEKIAYTIL